VAGDRLAVGAPDSAIAEVAAAGAAYLFERGALRRTLRETSARTGARFGAAVALAGDVVLVGAPGAPAGGADGAGVVWLFDATTGRTIEILSAPQPVADGGFGAAVGAAGDIVFVGAPGTPGGGAVYVFDAATLAVRRVLTAPAPAESLAFGRAVVAAGGDLLVGADGAEDGAGAAFLVDPDTGLVPRTFFPTRGSRFGFALAVVGDVFAIGEPAFGPRPANGRVSRFDEQTQPGSNVAGTSRPIARTPTTPAASTCSADGTPASVECRLASLRARVVQVGLVPLARPLVHAEQAVRAGDAQGGRRRLRAFRRAGRRLDVFAVRLAAVSPAQDLLAAARSVRADVERLAASD
jgi:hypothetical protein